MATTSIATNTPDLDTFEHHWQDEADAAFLYRILAKAESDSHKSDIYLRLAIVEDRHLEIWGKLLTDGGRPPKPCRPSGPARLFALLGKWFGPRLLLPMLLAEEGREVRGYLTMHRSTPEGVAGRGEALLLARESAEHASTLGEISGKGIEPWHRTESELMPEVERDELALIYEAKGMHRDAAHALATEVMADPQRMLEEQVQEELKIGDAHSSPLREAWLTGLATAIGALIPVFPFFFLTGVTAVSYTHL